MRETLTETNQNTQYIFALRPELETRWRRYLGIKPNQKELSSNHKSRLEFTRFFQSHLMNGLKLFHLSVTYKTYEDKTIFPALTDTFFINFYLKAFLPCLMRTHKYHLSKNRLNQPICYAFLDEHESKPDLDHPEIKFSERLHHHAIVAVNTIYLEHMRGLCGENTIPCESRFTKKVMTTHIRECEAMTTLYASKCFAKYPDFLSFPDRLH